MLTISIQVTFKGGGRGGGGGGSKSITQITISVLIFQSFPGSFRNNYVGYEKKWGGGLMLCGLW